MLPRFPGHPSLLLLPKSTGRKCCHLPFTGGWWLGHCRTICKFDGRWSIECFKSCVPRNLTHCLHSDNFLEDNFFDSRSSAVLFDQILVTPPQLFLTFVAVHISKAALDAVPSAAKRSWSLLASSAADAWKFWPISIYIL